MFGWCGKILRIDLSAGKWKTETPDPELYHKFIGGRGLGGYYLKPRVTLNWDDPDMPLLLFTGPLVNTPSPTSGRMTIMSRSPLTGTVGDASVGGAMGTELKRAGFDGIIITGKSREFCGIEIRDSSITISSAVRFKGKETGHVRSVLKSEQKGAVSTAIIGPAAENGVRFSSIMIDSHFAAGRNGLGLIFASKNIKYISIKGSGKTKIADLNALKKAREDIFRLTAASPVLLGDLGISRFGTGALYDLMDDRRMMPTDNFRSTRFNSAASMNAHAYKEKYQPVSAGCKGCHILCKKKTKNHVVMPEFETMSHFSALIGNTEMDTVVEANSICNDMGMDTISSAATLACYSEISKKKLLPEDICQLLKDIGNGKGEGIELGKGAAQYAKDRARPELAMAVKNQELAAYDPRGAFGMALAYATSTRGACHLQAYPVSHEILRKPVATDRFSFEGKARIIKISEDLNAVVDSLTACKFIFFAASLEEYSKAYSSVTGIMTSAQDLLKIGERIFYNERIMNAKNGFSKIHDDLPPRFFESPGYVGEDMDIRPINREDFLKALSNYYTVRGLDENGLPTEKKNKGT